MFGFDIARYLAIGMVVWQHALSLHGKSPSHLLPGLDVGQIGVTVFIAISGWFAFADSSEHPFRWLQRRLARIYVPMWITLVVLFTFNAALGGKQIDAWLVLSELLGTAGVTHGSSMVGVHLWFISLILACYFLASVIRLYPRLLLPVIFAMSLAAWRHALLCSAVLPFLLTGAARRSGGSAVVIASMSAVAAGITWLAGVRGGVWCPSAVGLGAVALAKAASEQWHWPAAWSWPSTASSASYHFYLAHAPVLRGLAMLGCFSAIVDALVGSILTVMAAAGLFLADSKIRKIIAATYSRAA